VYLRLSIFMTTVHTGCYTSRWVQPLRIIRSFWRADILINTNHAVQIESRGLQNRMNWNYSCGKREGEQGHGAITGSRNDSEDRRKHNRTKLTCNLLLFYWTLFAWGVSGQWQSECRGLALSEVSMKGIRHFRAKAALGTSRKWYFQTHSPHSNSDQNVVNLGDL
jgi:hypothetical protein